jgi:hypothetical protein
MKLNLDFYLKYDLRKIDTLAKSFAKSYYKYAQYIDSRLLASEHSVYMIVFSTIILELDSLNQNDLRKGGVSSANSDEYFLRNSYNSKSFTNLNSFNKSSSNYNQPKDNRFLDFMILLKNLNDGENFDMAFLKEIYKFSKLIGVSGYKSNSYDYYLKASIRENILTSNNKFYEKYGNKKFTVELKTEEKVKKYSFTLINDSFIVLFPYTITSDKENIDKLIFLRSENLYNYKLDWKQNIICIESKQSKRNIVIFKNKEKYIKYTKNNILFFKFENSNAFKDFTEIIINKNK